jgi:serine protease Do
MRGFGSIAERLRRSTVQIVSAERGASGSGIIWDSGGLILTNAHVARRRGALVQLWDGRSFPAQLLSSDRRRDVAALRVAAADLEPATPGDSSAARPGELVIAVGNPLGFAGALSTGIVHSVGSIPGMGAQIWIRADVRLAPGNSGGPLADAHGRVIGINTAILNGLGIAVPANDAAAFLSRGPRPSLGVELCPTPAGLLVLGVEPGGAAEIASLRPGDVSPISVDALEEALDSGRGTLCLPFLRGGNARVRQTVVRLEARAVAA